MKQTISIKTDFKDLESLRKFLSSETLCWRDVLVEVKITKYGITADVKKVIRLYPSSPFDRELKEAIKDLRNKAKEKLNQKLKNFDILEKYI